MSKTLQKSLLAILLLIFLGVQSVFAQVSIANHNTPVTTNFNGWNGSLPSGYTRSGPGNYVGNSVTTTGGVYDIPNNGFGYQPSSNANSQTLTGVYVNNTGSVITSLTISYEAFTIEVRNSRTPNWAVTSSLGNVEALNWTYNGSKTYNNPDTKTVTLTGLNIANGATFDIAFASNRGEGSGSSSMIGLNHIKVSSIPSTPPTILESETFLADFGDVMIGDNSTVKSLTFDAEGLISDVSVTAPAGFEISTDNINWYMGADVSPLNGMLDDVEIYVRFKPTVVGPYSAVITLTADEATTKTVLVTGNGIPNVVLAVTPENITGLGYAENGGPSASFQLTLLETVGLSPSEGNITISPALGETSNYEVSIDGTTWGSTALLPYTLADNTIQNPTIFVRIKAGLSEGPVAQETINVEGGTLTTSFTVEGTIAVASSIVVTEATFGSYCNGTENTFDLEFTPSGPFIETTFYAQLSDENGVFTDTFTNTVGSGTTSPILVTLPANTVAGNNYRVRILNNSPLTFSENDNGSAIVVHEAPTLSGVAQTETVCDTTLSTITIEGLVANSVSTIYYTLGDDATEQTAIITANSEGTAILDWTFLFTDNTKAFTIKSIERTDVTPSCSTAFTANNSFVIVVNPLPTLDSVTTSAVCGSGESTIIELTGLLPESTSTITYTIDETVYTVENIVANATGTANFEVVLVLENDNQTMSITSVKRTDLAVVCEQNFTDKNATLSVSERPTAIITGDQTICFGNISNEIAIALTGTAPWNITYSDGTSSTTVTGITESPYVFTVEILSTKTYSVTALSDVDCTALVSGLTGTATVTISPVTVGGTLTGSATVCSGNNTGTIQLENNVGAVIKWQASSIIDFSTDIADIENTTTFLQYENLIETTYYRAVLASGTCATAFSTVSAIIVNPLVTPNFEIIDALCMGNDAPTLSLTSPNGITGAWLPATISTLEAGTTVYVFTPAEGECATTQTLSVTVNPLTTAPTGEATQDFTTGNTLADFVLEGQNIKWYDAPVAGNELEATQLIVSGMVYYASQTIETGCGESIERLEITAGVDLGNTTFDEVHFKYYPNPVNDVLTLQYSQSIDSVEVYNLVGQLVLKKQDTASKIQLNMSELASGNYIARITSQGIIKNVKIIKR